MERADAEVARPLNVLIVSQPTSGGVAVYVQQLTEAAVRVGHRVTVVCPTRDHGPLANWVSEACASHRALNLERSPSIFDGIHLIRLQRLARGRDVVHLHSSKAGALGRVAVRLLGRRRPPVVFTPHAWSWLVNSPFRGFYRRIERALAGWTDVIVTVGDEEYALGRAVLGPKAPMKTIMNGVDRAHYSPDGSVSARSSKPLIVCVGRLSEQKGQDIAVRALARLRNSEAVLRLVGDGEQKPNLEKLAFELGMADRIEWAGHKEDIAPEYRAADVVVVPSRWDGLSFVLLEAMACGAAIVASDVPGAEVLEDAGIIATAGDDRQLARELDALLSNEPLRHDLGVRARDRSARVPLEKTLEQNLALWRELAGGADGRSRGLTWQDRGR